MTKHKEAAVRRPRRAAAQRAAARGRLVHPAAQHLGVHSVATRCALGLQAPPQPRNNWMVDDGEPATMGGQQRRRLSWASTGRGRSSRAQRAGPGLAGGLLQRLVGSHLGWSKPWHFGEPCYHTEGVLLILDTLGGSDPLPPDVAHPRASEDATGRCGGAGCGPRQRPSRPRKRGESPRSAHSRAAGSQQRPQPSEPTAGPGGGRLRPEGW